MTDQTAEATEPHVFLVDGSSYMFRSYFQSINQDPRYNARPSDGLPTGAVRLFMNKMLQFARDGAAGVRASHMVVAFDKGSDKNPRKQLLPQYKATRSEMPDDMKPQVRLVREAVRAMGIEPVESEGVEADDLIAAYAKAALAEGRKVLVVTSDKDLMQLVGPDVRFYDSESGTKGKPGYRPERNLDVEGVVAKWEGAPPERIGDVLALIGDKVDNIDGVPGIGLKTAAQLLAEHGDLETLLANAPNIKQPKRREALVEAADRIRLNRRIVALDDAVDMPVPLSGLAFDGPEPGRLVAFLKAMELTALVKRVGKEYRIDVDAVPADPALASAPSEPAAGEEISAGQAAANEAASEIRALRFDDTGYYPIDTVELLETWLSGATASGTVALSVEVYDDNIAGIGICLSPMDGAGYLPLGHGGAQDLFGGGLAAGQVPLDRAVALLKPVLADASVTKVFHGAKTAISAFRALGLAVAGYEDVELVSYALDSGRGGHWLEALSERHLGSIPPELKEVAGAKGRVSYTALPPRVALRWSARRADIVLRLWRMLSPRLGPAGVRHIYEDVDRPLVPVVARMEEAGIRIDRSELQRLSVEFGKGIAVLEEEIYALAGERFNIASAKTVGEIMFDRLGIPGGKRTPSGQWATPATLLDELAEAGHPFPGKVKAWREITKLKSNYTDGLQAVAEPGTSRVHTTFSLAATVTGRLSSSEPNLQNIPIRTEEGRRIRRAFVAAPGNRLVAADYSQVELRLLAHIADVPELREAFERGIDIHAATASAMFGVPLDGMDADIRRSAKTINFGIIYGISAFGLAARLGVPQSEAAAFIKDYFSKFPGIRDYIEDTKSACRTQGYVTTLFGRVCHYPNIASTNHAERSGVERQAINAPIQGTAADIVRQAMLRMQDGLDRAGLSANMLLQVHDELVFEVPEAEVEATIPVVVRVMEEAASPNVNLAVPLVVEAKAGLTWQEAH